MPDTRGNDNNGSSVEQPATTVQNAMTLAVAGEQVDVADSMIGVAAAGTMTANDSLILLGSIGALDGDARVVFDSKAAFMLGAGLGLILVIAGRLLGRPGKDDR